MHIAQRIDHRTTYMYSQPSGRLAHTWSCTKIKSVGEWPQQLDLHVGRNTQGEASGARHHSETGRPLPQVNEPMQSTAFSTLGVAKRIGRHEAHQVFCHTAYTMTHGGASPPARVAVNHAGHTLRR